MEADLIVSFRWLQERDRFKRTKWLERSGIYHQRQVCPFTERLRYDIWNKSKKKLNIHVWIGHNKINNMLYREGEFSFHASFKVKYSYF